MGGPATADLMFEQERNKDYITTLGRQKIYRIKGVDMRTLTQEWGPLLGRVALEDSSRDDAEFYVGPRSAILDGQVRVVSWVSPAAAVLFDSGTSWQGQQVRVKRRFQVRGHHVTGYSDAWVKSDGREAFPPPEAQPRLRPRPSARGASLIPGEGQAIGRRVNNAAEIERRKILRETMKGGRPRSKDLTPAAAQRPPKPNDEFLAANPDFAAALERGASAPPLGTVEDELVAALRAPRGEQLSSILPTLQPSQYRAVTSDPSSTFLFAGHPGTGKTVVATHRAAWLVNGDRSDSFDYILAVGPTESWASHVQGVIQDLGEVGRVEVRSMQGLLKFFLETDWVDSVERDNYMHTDEALGRLILRITEGRSRKAFAAAYSDLRAHRASRVEEQDLDLWCARLPAHADDALRQPELWPALALLKIRTDSFQKFQHVVVDEAQDIRPLEWMVLRALNAGQWTVVGDLNQRRTAFTPSSWEAVARYLGVERHDVVELEQGYRTTQQITDFASRLLGKRSRGRASAALGSGEEPRIIDARALGRTVEAAALTEAKRLANRHLGGRVAVITTQPGRLQAAAVRAGWERAGAKHKVGSFRRVNDDGIPLEFHLLHPNQARGLEFDGVVVVEPAEFRTLLGQHGGAGTHGPLYTSLTRANLSLTVVHWKPLPALLLPKR